MVLGRQIYYALLLSAIPLSSDGTAEEACRKLDFLKLWLPSSLDIPVTEFLGEVRRSTDRIYDT